MVNYSLHLVHVVAFCASLIAAKRDERRGYKELASSLSSYIGILGHLGMAILDRD